MQPSAQKQGTDATRRIDPAKIGGSMWVEDAEGNLFNLLYADQVVLLQVDPGQFTVVARRPQQAVRLFVGSRADCLRYLKELAAALKALSFAGEPPAVAGVIYRPRPGPGTERGRW